MMIYNLDVSFSLLLSYTLFIQIFNYIMIKHNLSHFSAAITTPQTENITNNGVELAHNSGGWKSGGVWTLLVNQHGNCEQERDKFTFVRSLLSI